MNITQLYEDIQSFIFRIWSKTFFEGFDLQRGLEFLMNDSYAVDVDFL